LQGQTLTLPQRQQLPPPRRVTTTGRSRRLYPREERPNGSETTPRGTATTGFGECLGGPRGEIQAQAQALAQLMTPARVAGPTSPNGIIEVQTAPWNSQNSAVSHSRDSHFISTASAQSPSSYPASPPRLCPLWQSPRTASEVAVRIANRRLVG
jgi:hypothetical protein